MKRVVHHIAIAGGIGVMMLTAACSHESTPEASAGSSMPPPQHAKQGSVRVRPHTNVAMLPVTRDTVQQLQRELQQDGFYHGPIDGVVGPQTHEALAAYQREHGLAQSAALDWPTLQQLAQSSSPAGSSPAGSSSTSGSSNQKSSAPAAPPSNQPAPPSGANPPPSGQSQ